MKENYCFHSSATQMEYYNLPFLFILGFSIFPLHNLLPFCLPNACPFDCTFYNYPPCSSM